MARLLSVLVLCFAAAFSTATAASAQTKSLKLYYLHTGEKAEITYKRGGRYLPSGLKKINWHLRDWRRNEPTKMDPKLLDLVWEAYRQSGSKAYIHVISGYRSAASNNLLRKRGRGVAKKSQHTLGKALDFFLPDVKLSKLREIGLKLGVGGVGYYPKSGSPFVHFDTGRVRHWPRMTRKQLVRVFPKGDTMHVPTDGKPLARYKQAVAAYERKKKSGKLIPEGPATAGGNFFQRLAARNQANDEEDDSSNSAAPTPRAVRTTTTPQPEAPEFAALPRRVPVPVVAPRDSLIDNGAEIVIATAEPPPEPAQIPETAPDPLRDPEGTPEDGLVRDETLDGETSSQDTEFALASLAIPVPARRPEIAIAEDAPQNAEETFGETPQPGAILAENKEPTNAGSALALVDPNAGSRTASGSNDTVVATLTPSEIEDLRSRVRATIGQTTLNTTLDAPIPSASLTAQNVNAPAPVLEPANIEVAAIEPAKPQEPEIQQTVAIEPGVETRNVLPLPEPNPIAENSAQPATPDTQIAAIDETDTDAPEPASTPEADSFAGVILANLPVPSSNPLGNTETVQAEAETEQNTSVVLAAVETPTPAQRPVTQALPQRTISLDRFSAPQNNSSTIGQFALATTTTIRDLADVRAPAYGRNVIRQVPNTILVQGFAPQPFGPGQNAFSGRAVNAMNFPKRRIN